MKNGDKRGMSDVISTVLIILLVLAAVGIIGAIILKSLGDSSSKIGTTTSCLNLEVTPVVCNISTAGAAGVATSGTNPRVLVSRGTRGSDASVSGVKLIFERADGTTETRDMVGIPAVSQTSAYTLPTTAPGVLTAVASKLTVAPVVKGTDGKDQICDASTVKVDCA